MPSGELFVEDSGEGAPVVLFHSSGLSGRQWRRVAKELPGRDLRAIVPDLTGHGRSPAWPEPTPFSYAVDVARASDLLASLDQPAHLVGHSYGGLIAALVAVAHPARVRSLVLYDPVTFGVLDPVTDADASRDLRAPWPSWDGSAEAADRWLEAFVDYWGGKGAWRELREDARGEFRRVGWVVFQAVTTLLRDATPASAYANLRIPTLLITGEASPVAAHRVVERLAASLPARVETVPGAGHMGPLTHGELVQRLVVEALVTPRPA